MKIVLIKVGKVTSKISNILDPVKAEQKKLDLLKEFNEIASKHESLALTKIDAQSL